MKEFMKEIKKIDLHAHVAPNMDLPAPVEWIREDTLLETYDALGIERGVLLPIVSPEGSWFTMPNEHVRAVVERHPDRYSWFCNVDPRGAENTVTSDLSSILMFYKERGAKGLGELTSNLYFDDPKMDNLFSHCEECEMPVLFHISPAPNAYYGAVDEIGLPRLEKMLKKHKNLKFIGHSQPFWAEISGDLNEDIRNTYPKGKVTEGRLAKLMREYPNLHCDLSAGSGANAMRRDPEYAARFLNEFADRIFYGCDICKSRHSFPFEFSDFLEQMRMDGAISEENYVKIVRGNALKLLGLDDQ